MGQEAEKHFQHLVAFRLATCRECRHGVWPDQIEGHMQRKHRASRKVAEEVGKGVRTWPGLIQYPSELELPGCAIQASNQLALYPDGLLCRLEASCRQIYRSKRAIKEHWRQSHAWSVGKGKGGSGKFKEAEMDTRFSQGCRQVYCQRFFIQGPKSQYFEVLEPLRGGEESLGSISIDPATAWGRVGSEMAQALERVRKNAEAAIRDGERDEVNLWLERT